MSLTLSTGPRAAAQAPAAIPVSGLMSLPGLVLVGMVVAVIFTLDIIKRVMATGFYLDPDDAMRMAQVHDYMAGQGWYDLTSWRLDAPHGVFMHWTRLVDVPIALLIGLFDLFADRETADRLARIAFPMLLLAGLFACTARIARMMAGALGPLVAVLLTILGGSMFGYFVPGRLDHDHVAVLLLVLMTGALLRALDPADVRAAALAGVAIALNLAVSLETLPFVVIGVAIIPAAWMLQGAVMQRALLVFASALGLSLVIAFLIVVGPARYLVGSCDTLSAAHLVAGLAGAGLCLALSVLTPRLPALALRVVAGGVAGAATIAALALTFPDCLGDPYAHIDPVLRDIWLANVSEARPLWVSLGVKPSLFPIFVVPLLLGLGATIWAAVAERGVMRHRWMALAALVLAGCAASVWQVRAMGVVAPLALFGAVWAVVRMSRPAFLAGQLYAAPLAIALALPFSPFGFGLVVPDDTTPTEMSRAKSEIGCRTADAFTALAALPAGIIMAPIDTGGHLLARTTHGIISAPFHRNEHGNRLVIDAFRADPGAAEAIVRGSGARYVVFCPAINDIEMYKDIAPHGLAAELDAGHVPGWLKPLPLATPYRVFEVQ